MLEGETIQETARTCLRLDFRGWRRKWNLACFELDVSRWVMEEQGPEDGALGDAAPAAASVQLFSIATCHDPSLKLEGNDAPGREGFANTTHPTVDKLLPQQDAHDIGAEVHNVLDLPEGLLCALEEWRKGKHLRSGSSVSATFLKLDFGTSSEFGSLFPFTCNRENRTRGGGGLSSSPLGGDVCILSRSH